MEHYAHSLEGRPREHWETMGEHEGRVARHCHAFLRRIDPILETWADPLACWHDLGKYLDDFQDRLDGKAISVDHAGVVLAGTD